MIKFLVRLLFATLSLTVFLNLFTSIALAQKTYEPTTESLSKHEVPDWFKDAKLGIFILRYRLFYNSGVDSMNSFWKQCIQNFQIQLTKKKGSY
ncbi:hypothetical protein NIES4072_70570 [Nostoc commune NIES-4072]|uniref:Glycoside hydrolase family 29 N-terminal domain-containing protein n=1 Tax=Nostoc commune NIES-4072 TaxID=2005467 RepID=A0A2R5FYK2_NOSCO|nr:hypothetical protein NIES4070_71010 [Nostoc commune HK-02]GBG23345.1 hypothetical protein NIES4072_70570 [Nostoc commune NIES-4072]